MLDLTQFSSLGAALRDALEQFGDDTALIEADRDRENARYSYSAYRAEANRFAALLAGYGFEPGDRCAILLQNQAKWPISATGALWAGAALVPLDYKLTPGEQRLLLIHSGAAAMVIEWPIWDRWLQETSGAPPQVTVYVTEAPDGAALGDALHWEEPTGFPPPYYEAQRSDLACVVYSSGTGGAPKGCQMTHGNYLEQAQALSRLYPMGRDEHYFSVLPTNHAIDFMCGFLMPMLMGAKVVHQRTLRPQFLASTMQRYGITHMALVPTILKSLETRLKERLAGQPAWKRRIVAALIAINTALTARKPNHALSRTLLKPIHEQFGGKLRYIFAGGAFVDPGCARFLYSVGLPVVIGYGLTEAGTVVTVNDCNPIRFDTVGKPVPGTQIELRNQDADGVGEVWVRGGTIMKGYWREPDLTTEAIVDGWLRTGDLGTLDGDGHLKLVGRSRNMIVTEGGKNIYPEDIEIAFENLPGAAEHCVFAANFIWRAHTLTGEQLILVIRPAEDAAPNDLASHIRERNRILPDYKRVHGYLLWQNEFPRTASLKLKRPVLAESLATLDRQTVHPV